MNVQSLYRNIPKVDILLENIKIQELIETYGRENGCGNHKREAWSRCRHILKSDAEENALERINSLYQI